MRPTQIALELNQLKGEINQLIERHAADLSGCAEELATLIERRNELVAELAILEAE